METLLDEIRALVRLLSLEAAAPNTHMREAYRVAHRRCKQLLAFAEMLRKGGYETPAKVITVVRYRSAPPIPKQAVRHRTVST